jgi:predicted NAD/FAD-binding protein
LTQSDAYRYKRAIITDWVSDLVDGIEPNPLEGLRHTTASDLIKFLSAHGIRLVVDDDVLEEEGPDECE